MENTSNSNILRRSNDIRSAPPAYKIITIYDLGPGFADRYTIVTTYINPRTGKYRALIIDEGATDTPFYEDVGNTFPKTQYGNKISYADLPKPVKDYLNRWNILPPNPVFEVACPSKMISVADIKRIADEIQVALIQENNLQDIRNSSPLDAMKKMGIDEFHDEFIRAIQK